MEMKFRDDTYSIAQHLEQIQMLYDYQTRGLIDFKKHLRIMIKMKR